MILIQIKIMKSNLQIRSSNLLPMPNCNRQSNHIRLVDSSTIQNNKHRNHQPKGTISPNMPKLSCYIISFIGKSCITPSYHIISFHFISYLPRPPKIPHPSRPWGATWAVWVWPENGPSHTALVNPSAWHRYAARAPQSLGYHNGHCCRSSVHTTLIALGLNGSCPHGVGQPSGDIIIERRLK